MTRVMPVLVMIFVLAAPSYASAACRWFGTQLDCDLGASRMVLGTQAEKDPVYSKSSRPQPLDGTGRVTDDRAAPALPFALKLQDVGGDVSLCQNKIENERYCD